MLAQLLHGILLATIFEVDKLHIGCNIHHCPKLFGSNVYATVDLDLARVGRTRMIKNENSNPQWQESFRIYCAHNISNIIFTVKVNNPIGAGLLGRAYVPVEDVLGGGSVVDRWVDILDGRQNPIGSKIHVKLQFLNATGDSHWSQGIGSAQFEGVPYTYFNQKQGCKVTLYQDAQLSDDNLPETLQSHLQNYTRQRCWEDIFDAISNAKNFIYIAGWSVYTEITLIRDPNRPKPGGNLTLGELLKKKADEGVTVLMLVWDDRTSVPQLKRDGLMATHDQDTGKYFKNTNVKCFLCPRNPDDGRSVVQGTEISTMFTHHQKTIIVDSAVLGGGGSEKRRIVSFVGGIDLCDGRYDTQEHSLFQTLSTTNRNDFHQANFAGASITKGGPREPWHDIHCQLEGPVAWDVFYNFEQRWKRQVGDQFLIPPSKIDELIIPPSPVTSPNDSETWNIQLFRSIDGGAAFGFPEKPDDAAALGLVSGKENVIDRSIQDAYINAIRRAKNFIYIENQYFLGSSFGWKSNDIQVENINALHLIPKELSLKIVSKIEAGERFAVHIVIPMWPEGIPESGSVQAILDWQRRTMEMMYSDIAQALQRKGIANADPRDYLNFFCLGNKERKSSGEYVPTETPQPNTDYSRAQQARRFMIYVHAKTMIVDDEYIIVGSANINQRSMDGARDSEIAMGAFQPHNLATGQPAKGQIYKFRMLLWYEHLGMYQEDFEQPESLACVKMVNSIAQENWETYSGNNATAYLDHAHLLRYPIEVSASGEITPLQGFEFFPDTNARVLGTKSKYLLPILTT